MRLTSEQLQVIRACAKDEASFEKIVSVLGVTSDSPEQPILSQAGMTLNLDDDQVKLLLEVFETLPVSVYVKDRQSRFVLANQLTCEMQNVDKLGELVGKTDFDFANTTNAVGYFDAEQALLNGDQSVLNFEIFIPEERGGPAWYLVTKAPIHDRDGRITGLVGVNQDITERKLAENALTEERNLLQTIIDHIPDKIYIKDRESRFVLANQATIKAQKITKIEDIAGTTDFDFMKYERAQQHFEAEQTLMRTGQSIINQELFVPAELAGHPIWFLVTKTPVYDDRGQACGLVGINRDITKRKLAEQKVLELTLEAERSNILADFITDASHEFRTVVAIIQTSAYLLGKTSDYAQQQQYVSDIVDHLNNLLRLIDSLITMSELDKAKSIEVAATNLNDLLYMIIERDCEQAYHQHLTIAFQPDERLQSIEANRDKLGKAFSKLLTNAIRHSPENGTINVRTIAYDDATAIEIADNGVGMTESIQSQIFKRFYRADAAHTTHGFGLGLPIAQRIVELHGGRIEVESEPDNGSTFRVVLPYTSA